MIHDIQLPVGLCERSTWPLMDTNEAADLLGISKSFLDKSRVRGDGPPFAKIGRRVVYRLGDIDHWLGARQRRSTSDPRGVRNAH